MKLKNVAFVNGLAVPGLGQVTSVSELHTGRKFDIATSDDGMWTVITALDGNSKGESVEVPFTNLRSRVRAPVVKEASKK